MNDNMDLVGRAFLITGANSGIGRITAIELAKRGGILTLAGRSEERTRPVLDEIAAFGGTASFMPMDLGDLNSTARAAKTFLDSGARLDVLINNAGIPGQSGLTKNGFEVTFGTNYLGPFLFTNLLLPRLREVSAARIVNVASSGQYRIKSIDWDSLRRPARLRAGFDEYCRSKLCNVLFTKELARGRAGASVHSYALHPGSVATNIWNAFPWPLGPIIKLFLLSVKEGARTSLHCAASPDVASDDGLFYEKCRVKEPAKLAQDKAVAAKLWEVSAEMVAPFMK